jgi:WD40 repeat protein
MRFEEAKDAVLALLRQQGKAKNSEMLALIGGDTALLEKVREDLLFEELAEDVRGAGLRYTGAAAATAEAETSPGPVKLFLSYGRRDALALAERLEKDLKARGYEVWRDVREIKSGGDWQGEIADGLRSAQVVVALLTPHSTRTTRDASSPDAVDSVCLGEIAHALFSPPPQPVVPVMAMSCEPPLAIFHLDYVDMRRWQDSEQQYQAGLERLVAGIEAARRGEKRYRSWHHLLDPFDFAAFLYPKREGFTGRRWLFDAIDVWRQGAGRDRALLIKGDPGTGKSAMVAELVHRNPDGQVLAYHCCQWDVAQTLEPWRFVRSIAAMIAGKLEDYAALLADPALQEILSEASCRADPASAFERGVLTPLQQLPEPEGGRRYLLVDALDEALLVPAGQPDIVTLLSSRLDRLPPWLRLVATTRKEPAVLERLAGLRAQELEAKSAENLADLRAYIHGRLETGELLEQVRETKKSAEELTALLLQKSEGNFLYARQALDGAAADQLSLRNIGALPPGLRGLYADRFARLFPDEASFADARAVLGVVCAAREPLDKEMLAEASGLGEKLPRVLVQLAAYIPRQPGADGQPVYAVYHKSFSDWLTDVEREGQLHYVSVRDGDRRLAEMCWQSYRLGAAAMRPYALSHLVAHLIGSQRWDETETVLLDLFYLEARVQAGQAFALVLEYSAAVEALPRDRLEWNRLRILEDALRRDIHFVNRHVAEYPQGLFQCLWNSAWWFDCPEAALYYLEPSGHWNHQGPKLHLLLEKWRREREAAHPGFPWLRSLRPATVPLGSAQKLVLGGHERRVDCVDVSPDGRWVASGSMDKTIRIWNAASGEERALLRGHEDSVGSVCFSPDGRSIASGSKDGTIRIWDVAVGKELAAWRGEEKVMAVCFSADGRRIISGCADTTVRIRDAASGEELAVLRGHEKEVNAVCLSPDGRKIASGSSDLTIRVWEAARGEELAVLKGPVKWVSSVCFSPDGRWIASGDGDKTIRVWDEEGRTEPVVLRSHQEWVSDVRFSPDGRRIASGSGDRTIRLWNAGTGAELAVLRGHEDGVTDICFSPDGRRIVSGSSDNTVRVWDPASGEETATLRGHDGTVSCASFSADGRLVASGAEDGTVRVWEVEGGRELAVLRGPQDIVIFVFFLPDGRRLATGSRDKLIRIWDLENGKELAVWSGHGNWVESVCASPDGRRVASASLDGTIRVWDGESGEQLAVLRQPEKTTHEQMLERIQKKFSVGMGSAWEPTRVSFSADGRWIVSESAGENTVRVWDAVTYRFVETAALGSDAASVWLGEETSPYVLWSQGAEAFLEIRTSGRKVCWYPGKFSRGARSLAGPQWAFGNVYRVGVLRLEGVVEPD